MFMNIVSPFVGILWMVSGSYGVGKLFLILNAMSLLNEAITLIVYTSIEHEVQTAICQLINIIFNILAVFVGTRLISVSRKLSTSKMFK